jgi:hypothetical protein
MGGTDMNDCRWNPTHVDALYNIALTHQCELRRDAELVRVYKRTAKAAK